MTDFAHSVFAQEARVRKAIRIEAALRMAGVDADGAAALDEPGRRGVEKTAGVRKSSDETWGVVLRLMGSIAPEPDAWKVCPWGDEQQVDPGACHNCGAALYSPITEVGPMRFCSQICAHAHRMWHRRRALSEVDATIEPVAKDPPK